MAWQDSIIVSGYLIAGVANVVPAAGILSRGALTRAYGVDVSTPELAVLLRHRAALFAVVGVLLLVAAFRPDLRLVAGLAGQFSMLSFVWIWWRERSASPQLRQIAAIDVAAAVILNVAMLLEFR
ncbi:MAG: hypothetical protein ACJAYU_001688 [Bradymonadia bacterium]|jgi:hypothetical protein